MIAHEGEVHLMFPAAPAVMPLVKQGRLRAIAVCTSEPSALAPGIPPLAITVPGFESMSPQGLFAPVGTPPAIVNRLQQEIAKSLHSEDVKQKLMLAGSSVTNTRNIRAVMRRDIDAEQLGGGTHTVE